MGWQCLRSSRIRGAALGGGGVVLYSDVRTAPAGLQAWEVAGWSAAYAYAAELGACGGGVAERRRAPDVQSSSQLHAPVQEMVAGAWDMEMNGHGQIRPTKRKCPPLPQARSNRAAPRPPDPAPAPKAYAHPAAPPHSYL